MGKVLVTGSEGFLGKHLVLRLLLEGYVVYGISLPPTSVIEHPNYHYTSLDILNREKLSRYFENSTFDAAIHLAALTTHEELTKDKEKTLRINLEGTLNLLEEFKKTKSTKFIFASTGKVYGRIQELPLSEDHPTSPINILGKSKLIAEKLIDFFSCEGTQQFIILRMFNVYGPGQRNYFLIPTILSQFRDGNNKITLGNIHDKRDYIFIEDVVEAIMIMLKKRLSENLNIFNVGSGKPHSASDIVKIIEEILGKKLRINVDRSRFRKDEFPEEYADIKKMSSLGWSPKHDLKAGLEKTTSHFI
ncbi:MAG: GDP-mannose 4,6-dehydratase [candidate division Zixibacteria bacterium]|nr:GDP-mannose 4,6-dehydratase [candidate division Zixibacteria bacterium]